MDLREIFLESLKADYLTGIVSYKNAIRLTCVLLGGTFGGWSIKAVIRLVREWRDEKENK